MMTSGDDGWHSKSLRLNIIMRAGEADPVLIDFGLSFNEDARTESFESNPARRERAFAPLQ
jgi:hypothetical protein